MCHVTKWAAAGANIAQNHKGCSTTAKTFTDIGTTGFLAHGMQTIVAQYFFYFLKAYRIWHFHANPIGLAQHGLRNDFDGNTRSFFGINLFDASYFCHCWTCSLLGSLIIIMRVF